MTCRQHRNSFAEEIRPIGVSDLITKSDGGVRLDYKNLPMSLRTRIKISLEKLRKYFTK
jgi:hypothetical protein